MGKKADYIDRGDTVRVIKVEALNGSSGDKSLLGHTGTVIHNNGWGLCQVRFLNGNVDSFWNDAQLERVDDG